MQINGRHKTLRVESRKSSARLVRPVAIKHYSPLLPPHQSLDATRAKCAETLLYNAAQCGKMQWLNSSLFYEELWGMQQREV